MSSVVLVEKTCSQCGETKPLSEFHRNNKSRDGHTWECKPCAIARVTALKERKRAEMGDEAWLESQRVATKASRVRRGYERERMWGRALTLAAADLRERHRAEYDRLVKLRMDELERAARNGGDTHG